MTTRSVTHASFTIERTYDSAVERVFAAWSTQEAKGRWFGGPDEWKKGKHQLDFRVGGRESVAGGPKGGTVHRYDAMYMDIVPNERIVSVYEMHLDDARISVSLATVEFKAEGKSTRLVLTEQGAFLDGYDDAGSRERGTRELLEKLAAALRQPA